MYIKQRVGNDWKVRKVNFLNYALKWLFTIGNDSESEYVPNDVAKMIIEGNSAE